MIFKRFYDIIEEINNGGVFVKVLSYRHIKPRQVFCHHCGAELEYLYTDVKTKNGNKHYITCPVCGKNIIVPKFEIIWGKIENNEVGM